jgi:formiminotetrahydrofolate cyclodeaminase
MKDLESWLRDMATQALPAGAAAAALAAAMGAALVAKAARVTLERGQPPDAAGAALEATFRLADARRPELRDLAEADERAYAAVLANGGRGKALREAVDVPLRIAEACQALLAALPDALDTCWPAVRPDLEIGGWLLQTGRDAGLLVAATNLRDWGDKLADASLSARLEVLKRGE